MRGGSEVEKEESSKEGERDIKRVRGWRKGRRVEKGKEGMRERVKEIGPDEEGSNRRGRVGDPMEKEGERG